ncbi:Kinase binding protein [Ophiocordyceps camponoti-floridani]|uniref:EKC/KEOPS complex subunit CGI121 n=1 Tax=Ophiocordyceps camponoti-floridani TaxID=2030778 RepID=A0A8H4Q247_9HYPO|nr:Kinase binding protein [Ophiocordyceps camponoti-floridani]
MTLETVSLEHVPSDFSIYVALFRDVQNAAFLHRQLLARNADYEYAFIDASILLSRNHLFAVVFKAILARWKNALETPNIHSEIVVNLSPSNNIADAYRLFGLSPSTTHLAVVKVTFPTGTNPMPPSSHVIWHHLSANVHGQAVSLTDDNIKAVTALAKVRKNYKINSLGWLPEDEAACRHQLEALVVSSMALRSL